MSPEQQNIIQRVAAQVEGQLSGEGSGHDWWHIVRVWNMAKRLALNESADLFVVELAALLHDIADWKFHDGDDTVGPKVARQILEQHAVSSEVAEHVCEIIATLSFKGAAVKTEMRTLEGKIVQDADRLDAIGAVGIARVFAYGGHKGQPLHDPQLAPTLHQSKEAYFKSTGTSVNHFYEKLLLLKERMNTKTAKEIAEGRHIVMESYLKRFFQEWDGEV